MVESVFAVFKRLGFPKDQIFNVEGLTKIFDLIPSKKKHCGVYCYYFTDGTYYIGKAVSYPRRYHQHLPRFSDAVYWGYLNASKTTQSETERVLIRKAQAFGLKIRNIEHVDFPFIGSDLDMVIPTRLQETWRTQASATSPRSVPIREMEKLAVEYSLRDNKKLEFFVRRESSTNDIKVAHHYLTQIVPHSRKTEYSHWVISCMPGASGNNYSRVCCISCGWVEGLVLFRDEGEGFVNLSRQAWKNIPTKIRKKVKSIATVSQIDYKNQAVTALFFESHAEYFEVMKIAQVKLAAREFSLGVMRKSPTPMFKYHNFALARKCF